MEERILIPALLVLEGSALIVLALWAIVRLATIQRTLRHLRDAGEDLRDRQERLIAVCLQLEAKVLRLWQQLGMPRR